MHPGSPRTRSQWGPWFALAVCFLAASVSHAETPSPFQPGEGERPLAAWTTFVLTSGDQFRPPPPVRGVRASSDQLAEVIARRQRLTPEWQARVAYWEIGRASCRERV